MTKGEEIMSRLTTGKKQRRYGLFEKQNGKWVHLYPSLTGSLQWCRRVFQDALLAHALVGTPERCLRPLKTEYVPYRPECDGWDSEIED